MTFQALPYILLQGFLFGSTLVASRFGVGQFSPLTYIGLRMVLASLCHIAVIYVARHGRWPRGPGLWRSAALLGIFGTAIPMAAFVSSLQYQSAGLTSVLLTSGSAVTVLMAHFFLPDERLSPLKAAGVSLALAGAVLLIVLGESGLPGVGRANPLGYALVLAAVVSGSSMTIYARKYMRDYDYLDVASVRMFVAALALMPLSLLLVGLDLGNVDAWGYAALVYATLVGTFAGLMLAFYTVKRFGATASAMPLYVIPVVATLGGALLLGERITAGMLACMTLIALGIGLINRASRG